MKMELISAGKGCVVLGGEGEVNKEKKILKDTLERHYFCPKRKSKMVYSLWAQRVKETWKGNFNMH